jgi:hypothetical protein
MDNSALYQIQTYYTRRCCNDVDLIQFNPEAFRRCRRVGETGVKSQIICEYSAAAEGNSERSGRLARPLPTKTWLMFPHSSIVT